MEKYLIMEKLQIFKNRTGRLLPVFFLILSSLFLFSACQKPLEKAYSIESSLNRMNSVATENRVAVYARPFSHDLAMPAEGDLYAQDLSSAKSFLLVSENDASRISYLDPCIRTYPASITKVMTALVCLESGVDLDSEFTITENSQIDIAGSSTANLRVGETISVRDLLYGMLVPSGNEASVAVAEACFGSVENCVLQMNKRALELGCTASYFKNPHGLPDDEHFTTAYDIYLILKEAMKHETFRQIVATSTYEVVYKDSNGARKTQVWTNSNRYLSGEVEVPEGIQILGGKTGTTNAAGYCLAQVVMRGENSYIAIAMKAESRDKLYKDMSELISKTP